MSSSSSLRLLAPIWIGRGSLLVVKHFLDSILAFLGVKGTRNLRQDLRSWATRGLMVDDLGLGPRRESKSEGVALGVEGEGDDCL